MKRWIALQMAFMTGVGALACTTFQIPQSPSKIMGNSFDWNHDTGMVLINKRNVRKTALNFSPGEKGASWVSQYGSVTFNEVGREFPLGGINEKGLSVEVMWLESSVYPAVDENPAVNELQWIQYILDGAASTAEAITLAQGVRVNDVFAKVHYLSCDASGECAAFEYIDGKLAIHSGSSLPVPSLTNNTYDESLAFLKQHTGFGGTLPIPQSFESLDRFVQATWRVQTYEGSAIPPVDYAFETLDRVAQGDLSKWNIVYEPAAGKVHFRSLQARTIKDIDTRSLDYSCRTPVKMLDANTSAVGDVAPLFSDYTLEANQNIVGSAISEFAQALPKGSVALIAAYPESVKCLE